jgi:tetratricopeptide (TPR) repeat protein
LCGLFLIFDKNGRELFSVRTTANLGVCCISDDSSLAIFETYASPTDDADKIFIIDISAKAIAHKFDRPHAFNKVKIDSKKKCLKLTDSKGFIFICDFEGNQKNREQYEAAIFAKGSVWDKLALYESKGEKEKIGALDDKDASYSFGKSNIYRKIGEFYMAAGNIPKTIENWNRALEIDPKVGVKRKLEALKKLKY